MFRSLVTIAALLGFVAGQLAGMPHAHAFASQAEQRQHDARPHVHVGYAHMHDHRHDANDDEPAVPDRGSGHDADAIYLPPTYLPAAGSVAVTKAGPDYRAQSGHGVFALLPFAHQDRAIDGTVVWHSPDAGAAFCAHFLKLRNLRI